MSLIKNFFYFWVKQANATIFWILLIVWIISTHYYFPLDFITRNDFLFIYALFIQIVLYILKLETWEEVKLIFLFHVVATILEVFKTYKWSWSYPGEWIFMIWAVPMFAWFMYSAVWSYLMRVWRLFDFQYINFPKIWYLYTLVALIYINFFSHHYIFDIRYILLCFSLLLFYKTTIYFTVNSHQKKMPLLLWFLLVGLFIWFAENIATYYQIWMYPNQTNGWEMVSFQKIIAWYLLMLLSFSLVTLIQKIKEKNN